MMQRATQRERGTEASEEDVKDRKLKANCAEEAAGIASRLTPGEGGGEAEVSKQEGVHQDDVWPQTALVMYTPPTRDEEL